MLRKNFFLNVLCILFFCALIHSAHAEPLTFQQRFAKAQAGDFIVTQQDGNFSVLFIRSVTADTLLLEEISGPEKQRDWKKWVAERAPGHTSWTLYEIDYPHGRLLECFSYSKNGWLYVDASEQFLARLLTLPLKNLSARERKKIGPAPSLSEEDHRALWNPPLTIDGKKVKKPSFDVLKTQWPNDASRLALSEIELYFYEAFAFPYWMEIKSPHYAFKVRAVDSGHELFSPLSGPMPHRSPQFLGAAQKELEMWKIPIQTPPYFQNVHLFVLDLTSESKATLSVPHTMQEEKGEEKKLFVKTADLKQILSNGHRYQWILIPEGAESIYVESEETFTWRH